MIFPDWGRPPTPHRSAALPLFREWAVDWGERMLCPAPGRAVSGQRGRGVENLGGTGCGRKSQRFRYTAWSADYGNELTLLLGGCVDQGILESQVRQYVRDALLASLYPGGGRVLLLEGEPGGGPVHRAHRLGGLPQKTEVSIR